MSQVFSKDTLNQIDAGCWILDSGQKKIALYLTESLKDDPLYQDIKGRVQALGKKIKRFVQSVKKAQKVNLRCSQG